MKEQEIKFFKKKHLDTKSSSFCGHKWYYATVQLWMGGTQSCFHNPGHQIDAEEIKLNPSAIHNTKFKKAERAQMLRGERPINCQFCWVIEESDPEAISDRMRYSTLYSPEELDLAFNADPNSDVQLRELEIAFDRTCQLACSYCSPYISSSWARDVRQNGPYVNLTTNGSDQYSNTQDHTVKYDYNDRNNNPYIEAFFKWWETDLHKHLRSIHFTGGEPTMGGYLWRFLDWCGEQKGTALENIGIITNLSYDDDVLDKLIDHINRAKRNIKHIMVLVSIENIGDKAEYVRDGLDSKQFEKNLKRLISESSVDTVYLQSTINAISIDGYLEYLHWIRDFRKENNCKGKLGTYINFVRFPAFQNIFILPMEKRIQYSDELIQFLSNTENTRYFKEDDLLLIKRLADYLKTVEVPHKGIIFEEQDYDNQEVVYIKPDLVKDFKNFFVQYDQRRNRNFEKTFPNLAEWYRSL